MHESPILDGDSHPDIRAPRQRWGKFRQPIIPLCQDLEGVLISLPHYLKHLSDELLGDALVKQIAHGVHEDGSRAFPAQWLVEAAWPDTQIEALFIRMPRDTAPALGKRLRVAMCAARRNLVAARDRVPRRIGPLDSTVVSQGNSSFGLVGSNPAMHYRTYVRFWLGHTSQRRRQCPLNCGWRFSPNAFVPSAKSSLSAHICLIVTSCSSVAASAGLAEASITRFARPTATGAHASSSFTRASVAASRSSGGATRLTRPIRSASVPSMIFDAIIISFARPRPTTLGSRELPPTSGIRPTRVSTRPITASAAIVRMSHASASSIAPPMQPPWICAIVGLSISSHRFHAASTPLRNSRRRSGCAESAPSALKSMPELNIAPSPLTTTHRTEESCAAACSAPARPAISSSFIALRFCGRFITT